MSDQIPGDSLVAEAASTATEIAGSEPDGEYPLRLDLLAFVSYDLVGSTALKSRNDKWPRVIDYFYDVSERLGTEMIGGTFVWKYLGDEVVLCKRISAKLELKGLATSAFRCLRAIIGELANEYPEESDTLSVKGLTWIAPIGSVSTEAMDPAVAGKHEELNKRFKSDDIVTGRKINGRKKDRPLDFLGPNIDAGFRLSVFARSKQLVVSPMLAYYLLAERANINDLQIVDFAVLKGVAKGNLYPGIWYHENWQNISDDFRYDERFTDPLTQRVCHGHTESVEVLEKVAKRKELDSYFLDHNLIDEILNTSNLVPPSNDTFSRLSPQEGKQSEIPLMTQP